jgi:exopolysaccharide biosynthesis polyprenyl glycosylphosphotransferase
MAERVIVETGTARVTDAQNDAGIFPASRWLQARPAVSRAAAENRFRDAAYRRSLALSDCIAALLALAITVSVAGHASLTWSSLLSLPAVVLFAKLRGLYDHDTLVLRRVTLDEVPHLFELATVFALATWLLDGSILGGSSLSRVAVLTLWGLLLALTVVGRATTRQLLRSLVKPERCIVIGRREVSRKLAHVLSMRRGLEVVGNFPMRSPEGGRYEPLNIAITQARERIRAAVEQDRVHRVILAVGESDDQTILDAIFVFEGLGLKVSVVPHMLEVIGSAGQFEDVQGTPILGVGNFGLSRSSMIIKRAFDLAFGSLALLFAAPIFLVVAIAVKLSSPGPVFFRQLRVGRRGERFEMFKFRTMYEGSHAMRAQLADRNETSGLFKIGDDPRITSVGGWLRQASLDELPQLINVIRGEMSLVGPRPLIPEEDGKVLGWGRRRLHLTPGMTGPWQVLGATRVPLQEMVKIDYLYIANWSLWADVKALLQTFPHVAARRGM